jgi:hypothetical protein
MIQSQETNNGRSSWGLIKPEPRRLVKSLGLGLGYH